MKHPYFKYIAFSLFYIVLTGRLLSILLIFSFDGLLGLLLLAFKLFILNFSLYLVTDRKTLSKPFKILIYIYLSLAFLSGLLSFSIFYIFASSIGLFSEFIYPLFLFLYVRRNKKSIRYSRNILYTLGGFFMFGLVQIGFAFFGPRGPEDWGPVLLLIGVAGLLVVSIPIAIVYGLIKLFKQMRSK